MSKSNNGSENAQNSSSSSGMGKGNKCKNTLVKNHIYPNSPPIHPSLLQRGLINTQPASKYQASLDQRVYQILQEENQIILSPNQNINQNLDIQIDQNQMNNQQYIQVVPNEIITQENNGHVQNLNNQMNYSQNDQDQVNDRERSKKITIVDTEALNGLTEKINKLADNIDLLIKAQKESLKAQNELLKAQNESLIKQDNIYQAIVDSSQKQDNIYQAIVNSNQKQDNIYQEIVTSNQNQAKLLDLLTKKFFLEENEKVPSIDNDQSKNKQIKLLVKILN